MGNQPTKLDYSSYNPSQNRSLSIQTSNRKRLSRQSISNSNVPIATTKQENTTASRLSLIGINSIGRSSSRVIRSDSLPIPQAIRVQNSFSSQSSDTNNSTTGTGMQHASSNDSLNQSEYTDTRVSRRNSRRNSRRISWRAWQRAITQEPTGTRLVEGRTHVRIGNTCALLPSDLLETDSMDRFHYIVKHVLDGNYQGKLPYSPRKILDVGTGSGIWIREMAIEFPDSKVIGCDVVDLTVGDVLPTNCKWTECNILHGLPFDDDQFDLVHQRQLGFYLPTKRLSRTLQELYRACSPDGQVQLMEMGIHWEPIGHNVAELQRLLRSGLSNAGIDPNALEQMEPRLRQAGFVDIQSKRIAVPVGAWGGLVGRILADATRHMIESARPVLVRYCKLRSHEVHSIINNALAEMEINQCCAVMYFYHARKPFGNASSMTTLATLPATPATPTFRWSITSFRRNSSVNTERTSWMTRRFSTPPENG
ncbi:S-adenosyl-L-methionine-dependent methyltransferase [Syncephalis plumigaleata]|nr:S-adenosyl-L-methionine-dependent methyltransferase [Syncephalis plumigaleata]